MAKTRAEIETEIGLFLNEWFKQPPLVRASAASALAIAEEERAQSCANDSGLMRDRGLHRRAKVLRHFEETHLNLAYLFTMLAAQGDDEAVEKGIDTDARYTPDPSPVPLEATITVKQTWVLTSTAPPGFEPKE